MKEIDRKVLEAIAHHRQMHGRPPNLNELAQAVGYGPRSGSAVHRRLQHMRDVYVTWEDHQPRTLELLRPGVAMLQQEGGADSQEMTHSIESMEGEVALDLHLLLGRIARGLKALVGNSDDKTESRGDDVPPDLRRSLNQLNLHGLAQNTTFPSDLPAFIDMCQRPLIEWPLGLPPGFDGQASFLEGGELSGMCLEHAATREEDLIQEQVANARDACSLAGDQMAYVAFRRLLIEHPILLGMDILKRSNLHLPDSSRDLLDNLWERIQTIYEPVPSYTVRRNKVLVCAHCGWTLDHRTYPRPSCGSRVCSHYTNDFTKVGDGKPVSQHWLRVLPAIQAYTVVPGLAELSLAKQLRAMPGLQVELWPDFDAFDLSIHFPKGDMWAVDVKDWQCPFALAHRVDLFPTVPSWHQAWYIFPNHRAKLHPRYVYAFQTHWKSQNGVRSGLVRDFLRTVKQKWKEEI